jgi:hypothetical protein
VRRRNEFLQGRVAAGARWVPGQEVGQELVTCAPSATLGQVRAPLLVLSFSMFFIITVLYPFDLSFLYLVTEIFSTCTCPAGPCPDGDPPRAPRVDRGRGRAAQGTHHACRHMQGRRAGLGGVREGEGGGRAGEGAAPYAWDLEGSKLRTSSYL